jgi:hypothetical protein
MSAPNALISKESIDTNDDVFSRTEGKTMLPMNGLMQLVRRTSLLTLIALAAQSAYAYDFVVSDGTGQGLGTVRIGSTALCANIEPLYGYQPVVYGSLSGSTAAGCAITSVTVYLNPLPSDWSDPMPITASFASLPGGTFYVCKTKTSFQPAIVTDERQCL